MRKDIEIPVVSNVEVAAVLEWNEEFLQECWYAYIFNNTLHDLEAVMIVSQAKGFIDGKEKQSSLFRHAFAKLAPKECQKIELLDEALFQLDNTFMVTFFSEGKLYDKTFLISANTISKDNCTPIENFSVKGVLAE